MSDYTSQTVAQLKEVLKSKSLSTEGKKADLIQRLNENDAKANEEEEEEQQQQQQDELLPIETVESSEPKESEIKPETESTLTVIQPSSEPNEKEKTKPKDLSPEERKQLALELLNKKIQRAEKFGDEAAAEAAKKDLIRVEKFGVEAGTALAREIGLVDRGLGNGNRKKFHNKKSTKNFGHRKNFKPKFGAKANNRRRQ